MPGNNTPPKLTDCAMDLDVMPEEPLRKRGRAAHKHGARPACEENLHSDAAGGDLKHLSGYATPALSYKMVNARCGGWLCRLHCNKNKDTACITSLAIQISDAAVLCLTPCVPPVLHAA